MSLKEFFRKRNIPKSKKKNYTVKPMTGVQKDKRDINRDKFDDIIHTKELEEMTLSDAIMDEITNEYLESLDTTWGGYDADIADGNYGTVPDLEDKQNVVSYFIVDPTKINTKTTAYARAGGTGVPLAMTSPGSRVSISDR